MVLEFSGPATSVTDRDLEDAAIRLDCMVAAVRAVLDVESRGGFLRDTRPKILFERHYFSRLTDGRFDEGHPEISNHKPGGYAGGAAEYDRLREAMALDRDAALRSASWGSFQIMGDNFKLAGFSTIGGFVDAMCRGEGEHLKAFVTFAEKRGLADELRRCDWLGFARGYNGANFAINRYDTKLAAAFAFHSAGGSRTRSPLPVLKIGASGGEVKTLQAALGVSVDGDFGPTTKAAVLAFQKSKGMYADGIVGPQTWRGLGL